MTLPSLIIRERIYIPEEDVSKSRLQKHYVVTRYEEPSCKKCEYRPERHSYLCDSCPAFLERISLFKKKKIKGVRYIGIPIGDKKNVQKKLGISLWDYKVEDRRTAPAFEHKIKFVATLRPTQEELVAEFFKNGAYGILEAPPRTGKSITSLFVCLKLGLKTLVLASQHEFLTQIQDHIHGNEPEGIPKCTNLPELQERVGKKLYGFPKKEQDFKDFQILFMTYQSLISEKNGKQRIDWINKYVGTIFIDECHQAPATCFSQVIASIRAKNKMGCTGTVERKDKKEFLTKAILGPVNASTSIESMVPVVYVHRTKLKGKRFSQGKASWVYAMQHIAKDDERNKYIVRQALRDIKAGYSIVIPVLFTAHVDLLVKMINDAYGSEIAEPFKGGGANKSKELRRAILARAKSGETLVVVGIRRLMTLSLNVPAWSCIYEVMPISNKPNLKQETSRVRTPKDGKMTPIVRLFVDKDQGQSLGCAKATIGHLKSFKYKFAASTDEKQKEILADVLDREKKEDILSDIEGNYDKWKPKNKKVLTGRRL